MISGNNPCIHAGPVLTSRCKPRDGVSFTEGSQKWGRIGPDQARLQSLTCLNTGYGRENFPSGLSTLHSNLQPRLKEYRNVRHAQGEVHNARQPVKSCFLHNPALCAKMEEDSAARGEMSVETDPELTQVLESADKDNKQLL